MSEKNVSWLKMTEEFFFAAMKEGWARGDTGRAVRFFPNTHKIVFRDPEHFPRFTLIDCWGKDPDTGRATGSTTIFHYDLVVWAMWYGEGSYEKEALPCLKQALLENYKKNIFLGGRGPFEFRHGTLIYKNNCEGDFTRFSGSESIVDAAKPRNKRLLGGHHYRGGSLMYLPPQIAE